jgi:hypothetical protein
MFTHTQGLTSMQRGQLSGPLPQALMNEISDAIHRATKRGMRVDEATCVVVSTAADYARGA